MTYTIKTLGPVSQFNTKNGPMKSYGVQFESSDEWVTINQKDTTPAPTVGQVLEGTIENTDFGRRFKKTPGGSFTPGGAPRHDSPEQRQSIEYQTCLKAAVEAVRDYYTLSMTAKVNTHEAYVQDVISTAASFAATLEAKPKEALPSSGDRTRDPIPAPEEQAEIDLSRSPF